MMETNIDPVENNLRFHVINVANPILNINEPYSIQGKYITSRSYILQENGSMMVIDVNYDFETRDL